MRWIRKLTLEECHEIAKKRGGECLSTEYVNNKTKMQWKCEDSHEWDAVFDNIKNQNRWCLICAGMERLTLEECHEIAKKRGGECLSTEYVNNKTKMQWKCHGGHQWDATFGSIKNSNRWCPTCNPKYSKMATTWLLLVSKMKNIDIQHSENEFKIPGTNYKADGYCQETNTIYEFHGDYWHGNPKKYLPHEYHPVSKKTFGELYENTITRENTLRELGYNVVSIWERDWKILTRIVTKIQRIVKKRYLK